MEIPCVIPSVVLGPKSGLQDLKGFGRSCSKRSINTELVVCKLHNPGVAWTMELDVDELN